MKQRFLRLIRHDRSLFIEPIKRRFRSFGVDFAAELTGSAGGNHGPSDPESNEVVDQPGEAAVRSSSPNRTPALADHYEGQLDPDLVRDVFAVANTPVEHSTLPGNHLEAVILTVGTDCEEVDGEESLSPNSTHTADDEAMRVSLEEQGTEADSIQPPDRDAPSNYASTSKLPAEPRPTTMVKTMVETIADRTLGGEQGLDFLADGLEELFVKNARVNVGVKTLLLNLEPVDIRELTEELQDFAKSIGAIKRPE